MSAALLHLVTFTVQPLLVLADLKGRALLKVISEYWSVWLEQGFIGQVFGVGLFTNKGHKW